MTKMKKLSALTAAVLAFTMVGTIGASASTISTNNYTDDDAGKSAEITLKVNPTPITQPGEDTVINEATDNDTMNHVWYIDVNQTELTWNITTHYKNKGAKYGLKWDPETCTYVRDDDSTNATDPSDEQKDFMFSVVPQGEDITKSVSITNKSNFPVGYTTNLTYNENSEYDGLFMLATEGNTGSGDIAVNGGATIDILINQEKLEHLEFLNNTAVGKATISFTPGEIYIPDQNGGN